MRKAFARTSHNLALYPMGFTILMIGIVTVPFCFLIDRLMYRNR